MWEAFFAFHICIARCKFLRCQVAQSAVRAHPVVIDPPALDGLPRIVQSEEPVFVEALLAELTIDPMANLHSPLLTAVRCAGTADTGGLRFA